MKSIFFHLMPYRDLPADFETRHECIWVTPPNSELCDPKKVAQYYQWNLDEAARRASSSPAAPPPSPTG
jgi:hypothetical protein